MSAAKTQYGCAVAVILALCSAMLISQKLHEYSENPQERFSTEISFEENRGQWNSDLRMLARSAGGLIALRDDRIELISRAGAQSSIQLRWLAGNESPALLGESSQGYSSY